MGFASYQQFFPIANPAAGGGFTRVVPSDYFEKLLALHAILTTSATVANRMPYLLLLDGDNNIMARLSHNISVAAGSTVELTWIVDTDTVALSNTGPSVCPLPDFYMLPGWKFNLAAAGIQAADTFTQVGMLVFRYPHGPNFPAPGSVPWRPALEVEIK